MKTKNENAHVLEKNLKPSSIFAIAVGSIIGYACFVLPGDWLVQAGPMGIAIAFILGAISISFIGKGYGFMIGEYPVAGGAFAFAYKGFGRNHAFICGWLLTLGYLSVVALNATALPIIARFVAPDLFMKGYLYTIAGWDVYLGEVLVSIFAILVFGVLNIKGSEIVGKIQFVMVAALVGAVGLLGIGALTHNGLQPENLLPYFAPGKSPWSAILSILAIAPMAYVGFDTIPHAAEEFDFSPKLAYGLIILAVSLGGLMYIIVSVSTAEVMPWLTLVEGDNVWATGTAIKMSMGSFGLFALVTGVCMGICTGMNGFYMATSRLLLSMARAKVLPQGFEAIHSTRKTPQNAILFTMIACIILPLFGRQAVAWVVDMCSVGTAVSFIYTCLTAVQIAKEKSVSLLEMFVLKVATGFSVAFLLLLIAPMSPAFMPFESWILLGIWSVLGVVFYLIQASVFRAVPKHTLDKLILNTTE